MYLWRGRNRQREAHRLAWADTYFLELSLESEQRGYSFTLRRVLPSVDVYSILFRACIRVGDDGGDRFQTIRCGGGLDPSEARQNPLASPGASKPWDNTSSEQRGGCMPQT